MERKVNAKGVPKSFHVAQLVTFSNLLDVHHVIETKECVDIDARLEAARQLQRALDELDCVCFEQDLAPVFLLVDRCNHLGEESKSVRYHLCLLLDTHIEDLLRKVNQEAHRIGDLVYFEKLLLMLEVEKDFANNHLSK